MASHPLTPLVLDGWYVLHQLFHFEPARDDGGVADRAEAFSALFSEWEDLGDGGWSGFYGVVGGGADYMAVHFRPTLDELRDTERTLRRHPAAVDLTLTEDYLSVVELGLYAVTAALLEKAAMDGIEVRSKEWDALVSDTLELEGAKPYTQRRLAPRQPDEMPYICFYPMDKRRTGEANWYTHSLEDRAALMADHGATGRRYAGRVSQIISGSVGFDDWEWGVTLFTGDPLNFKSLITEMRYDEASSRFAEFGSFWVGVRLPAAAISQEFAGGS